MPKTTGQTAAKAYRAIAKPYDALAEKFQTDASTLSAEIDAGQRIWQDVQLPCLNLSAMANVAPVGSQYWPSLAGL